MSAQRLIKNIIDQVDNKPQSRRPLFGRWCRKVDQLEPATIIGNMLTIFLAGTDSTMSILCSWAAKYRKCANPIARAHIQCRTANTRSLFHIARLQSG
mmetsp:Transcript_1517/g.2620  ORF Transcript_1517/g.2620 Transcript_1517/m.2620 type:complete len:98 (-) Transcript_1517:222-515(-)